MPKPFAYDLGDFDPIFPGITLRFPNEAIWRHTGAVAALRYSLAAEVMLDRDPTLTADKITPDLIVETLLKDKTFGSPLSPEEKDRLGLSLIAATSDDAVGYLAAGSAHEHERRHFHDWFLSPYTAAINAMRVEVSLNYAQLRPVVFAKGTTVVPVPLPRWLRKTTNEQAELVRMWEGLLGETVQVRVPDLSFPGVLPAIEAIERRYGSIGLLFSPLGGLPGLSAAIVFEASATLIQTQAIHDSFGETASNRFALEMTDPANRTPYGYVLAPMARWLKPGELLENDTLSTLITWCLLGNENVDKDNSNPIVRVLRVYNYLDKHGFPPLGTSARMIFDALDKASGSVPYAELLARSVQLNNSILGNILADIKAETNPSKFEIGVVQAYSLLNACHQYMVEHFLDDPDGYAKPVDYLDRTLGIWPEPPVRLSFGKPFRRMKREELATYQRFILYDEDAGPDQVFLRQGITGRDEPVPMKIDIQIADNWLYACTLTDLLFAEFNRDQHEFELQRDLFKKDGFYLMEVLT